MPSLVSPEGRAQTADVDRRIARVGRIELDGRDQLLETVHVERRPIVNAMAAHDRHRNRHLLRGFLDAPGRHDHCLGDLRRHQRHLDCRRLSEVEHDPSDRGVEPLEHGLEAIWAGRQRVGAIRAFIVADGGGAGALVHDADERAGIGAPDKSRTTPVMMFVPIWALAAAGNNATTSAATIVNHVRDIEAPSAVRARPAIQTVRPAARTAIPSLV